MNVYIIIKYSGPQYLNLQSLQWESNLTLSCLHENENFLEEISKRFPGSHVEERSVVDWSDYDRKD